MSIDATIFVMRCLVYVYHESEAGTIKNKKRNVWYTLILYKTTAIWRDNYRLLRDNLNQLSESGLGSLACSASCRHMQIYARVM